MQITFIAAHHGAGASLRENLLPHLRAPPGSARLVASCSACAEAAGRQRGSLSPPPTRSWSRAGGQIPRRVPSAGPRERGAGQQRRPAGGKFLRIRAAGAHLARAPGTARVPAVPGVQPTCRNPGWGGLRVSPVAQLPLWPSMRQPRQCPHSGGPGWEGSETWWLWPEGTPRALGAVSTCAGQPRTRSPSLGSGSQGVRKILLTQPFSKALGGSVG